MLTLMLASMENPQKQMRANPSVTWIKTGEFYDHDNVIYDNDFDDDYDNDYDDDDDGDGDDVSDDYKDASNEADGEKLSTFPLRTKLSADNLTILIVIDIMRMMMMMMMMMTMMYV